MALAAWLKTQRDVSKSNETSPRGSNPPSRRYSPLGTNVTSFGSSSINGSARVHQGTHYGDVTQNSMRNAAKDLFIVGTENYLVYLQAQEHSTAASKGNEIWQIKRVPNTSFVGQKDAFYSMEKALLPGRKIAQVGRGSRRYVLHGIGGVRKSELALQFAQRHRQRYWGVFWVDFASKKSVQDSYFQILAKLGLSAANDEVMETVNDHLSNLKRSWLLILDNCDDPGANYQAHYPNSDQGTIIMTTRTDFSVEHGSTGHLHLDGLDPQSSRDLLLKISRCKLDRKENVEAAKNIVKHLGHHALAVTVAGSLIGQAKLYSLTEYAEVLGQKTGELFNYQMKQANSIYGTIYATFDVSAKRLENSKSPKSAHALQLLNALAFLDRTDIDENIFTRALHFGKKIKVRGGAGPRPGYKHGDIETLSMWHYDKAVAFAGSMPEGIRIFRNARFCLHELALISCDADTHSISMHPLIHAWARKRLSKEAYAQAWVTCAATLALSLEEAQGWRDFTPKIQRHLEVCFALRTPDWYRRFPVLEVCRIFNFFAWQLYRGYSLHAEDVGMEIEKAGIGALDKRFHTLVDLQVLYLKMVLLHDRDPTQAFQVCKLVFSKRKNLLPPEHPDLLTSQAELAHAYIDLKKPEQAIPLLREVINIRGKTGSSYDQSLLAVEHQLGRAYSKNGQIERAIGSWRSTVAKFEPTLPSEDPDLLAIQHGLAQAYSACGKWKLSIELLERVVNTRRRILARTSADRFASEHELVRVYIDSSQLSEAQHLLQTIKGDQDSHLLSADQRMRLQTLWNELEHKMSLRHERVARKAKEAVEGELPLPGDAINKLQILIYVAREYLRYEQVELARKAFERVKSRQERLPEQWREDFKSLETALKEYDKSGQVPQWLFYWPYRA